MSLPVVLVRVGTDVVPVVAGQDERGASVGYDLVRDQVIPLDVGRVVGAVSTDPAAVYWGLDLVEEERGHRMAAEGRHSACPPSNGRGMRPSDGYMDRYVGGVECSGTLRVAASFSTVATIGVPAETENEPARLRPRMAAESRRRGRAGPRSRVALMS